ncbi:MAG: DUF6456 domain-containing protein [Paracoccus sp. (in: a-proteobacteria)]|nr:DUF6456 domain-containing protein [Paracoccus sp. (in: a-proteobacteria)]
MSLFTADFPCDQAINQPVYDGNAQLPAPADLSCADANLYLRHVGNGESIRAIARAEGCHASTILRRIRRFEQRRDDPLVDQALERPLAELPRRVDRKTADLTRKALRRLSEKGAELVVASGMENAIITRGDIRTMTLARELAETFALKSWVEVIGGSARLTRYRVTASGRAAAREMGRASGYDGGVPRGRDFENAEPVTPEAAPNAFAEQHSVWEKRTITDPEDGARKRVRFNIGESPLLLLARRRDALGKPFLGPDLVTAGERLREDFELAQIGPRVAQNWDRFMTAGVDEGLSPRMGGSDKARQRVADALRELGPGMGDLVLRVCCFLEGLEMTERRLGWSARSGKVVLKLALERLARHYEARYGKGGPLIG